MVSAGFSSRKRFVPRGYQRQAIRFLTEREGAGLFLDPGLGKTMCAYEAFLTLRRRGAARRLLVVTLIRPMTRVWPQQIEEWGLSLRCVALHGAKKERALLSDADVYVVNYEGLPWLFDAMRRLRLTDRFDVIAFDESSKLRNTNTQRFKLVRQHIGWFRRRWILTGSPTPKGLLNLFGQVYVLDEGRALGRYVTHYRREYFDELPMRGGWSNWELKEGAEQRIYAAIKPLVIRFGDELLDMPPLVFTDVEVDLPRAARRAYDDLERDLIAMIDADLVLAKNAGVVTQKLRQIANGGLYIDDRAAAGQLGRTVLHGARHLHDAKTEAVLELLEELEGQPALVGYEFHHDRDRLLRALPKGTPWLGGGQTAKETERALDAWDRGDVPVLLGQTHAVAHGLNLQGRGRAVIYHSLTWDLEDYEQFYRRVWRQGQKSKVMVYRVIARRTVDEAIRDAIAAKGKAQRDLFAALRRYVTTKKEAAR